MFLKTLILLNRDVIGNEGEKMKVIQINALGKTMSTGRTTREMHDYMKNHNIDSYIVCPAPLDCNDAFFFSKRWRMKIDTMLQMITGLEGYHSYTATRKLIKYLDKISPDIVHLRVIHSNCINLHVLLKYLSKKNIATVITLHDFWFLTGKCCYFTALKCDKWVTGCYKCPRPQVKHRPMLFERSKKMWTDKKNALLKIKKLAFVGVSDWVTNEAKKSPFTNGKIVRRIYNWVDLETFLPHDASYLRNNLGISDKFVVLGVSSFWSIDDRKGLNLYIKLAESLPDIYSIILIGKINEDVLLPSNLIHVDSIKDKSLLADYYSMADCYLNLSLEETFGKVSAESLSCGTPVVAIDSTANKELVPKECGVIIDSLKIDEIENALRAIKNNKKEHYSINCRKFAEQMFNMETNIQEYIYLYEELIKEKNNEK